MSSVHHNARRFAIALALCGGMSALPVLAQPGPHGHHERGLGHAIIALQSQLSLSASQQTALDAAMASGKAARDAAKQSRQTLRQLAQDELAQATPDLGKIATATDQAHDTATLARRGVRNQLLQLYATFSPAQVAVVKDALSKRAARMESFRERMKERFGKN